MSMLLGCDPEFFLFDDRNGRYVSAHDKVPGTKNNPFKLKNGAVQADGTAVEFNIDPASTSEEFVYNIDSVLSQIRNMIPKHYSFKYQSSVEFDPVIWNEIPEYAKEIGCGADFDASFNNPTANDTPKKEILKNCRTAAGHLHIGWTTDKHIYEPSHFWDCRAVTMQLSNLFSPLQKIFDNNYLLRTKFYGSGPVFRPKNYGVEYRELSNGWLNKRKAWKWIFDGCKTVYDNLKIGKKVGSSLRYESLSFGANHNSNIENYNVVAKQYGFPILSL